MTPNGVEYLQACIEKSDKTAQISPHQVVTFGPTAVAQLAAVLIAGGIMVVLVEPKCKVGKMGSK